MEKAYEKLKQTIDRMQSIVQRTPPPAPQTGQVVTPKNTTEYIKFVTEASLREWYRAAAADVVAREAAIKKREKASDLRLAMADAELCEAHSIVVRAAHLVEQTRQGGIVAEIAAGRSRIASLNDHLSAPDHRPKPRKG